MFQFPALATMIQSWTTVLQTAGLSHSEIRGLKVICTYPQLIAAYHVLLRLREPRHPPFALTYFFVFYPVRFMFLPVLFYCVILLFLTQYVKDRLS